jgi:hypothetical protein
VCDSRLEVVPYACCGGEGTTEAAAAVARGGYRSAAVGGLVWRWGLTATPEEAQQMHECIRGCLAEIDGVNASATRLLYGGSVKADNAAQLFAQADIDGALVGGAALLAADFLAIVNAATA